MAQRLAGWGSGLLGVAIFSGTFPATRVAVEDLAPVFLTSARAVIAAMLAAILLAGLRQRRPERRDLPGLGAVAFGVVVGFPLLIALALRQATAAYATVFIGLLPLATAIFAVLRGGERPAPAFWLCTGVGAATIAGFALPGSSGGALEATLLMVSAITLCGFGYAEGAVLARRLGGWQVISWALILALPATLPLMVATWPEGLDHVSIPGWLGLGYVSVFSMLVGFVFWYRGLALGGIAGVSQLQLLQPFLGLVFAALLLGERVTPAMIACSAVVVLCVAVARQHAGPSGGAARSPHPEHAPDPHPIQREIPHAPARDLL